MSIDHPVVVMGVSGSGKSTVGAALAGRLRVPFEDADDLHPSANIAKMSRGEALDDHDRWPWLELIGDVAGQPRRRRGDGLLGAEAEVPRPDARPPPIGRVPAALEGDRETIERRQAARPGHFMPASLLTSQFATLEPLAPDERGVVLDVDQSVDRDRRGIPRPEGQRRLGGPAMHALLVNAADDLIEPVASGWQLVTAALVAIALIVVLITVAKLNPFLALVLGGLTVGIIAGENVLDVLASFTTGFGDHGRRGRHPDRAGCDVRQAARRLGRGRPDRRHDRRPGLAADAAVGDGRWSARSSGCRCSSRSAWCC